MAKASSAAWRDAGVPTAGTMIRPGAQTVSSGGPWTTSVGTGEKRTIVSTSGVKSVLPSLCRSDAPSTSRPYPLCTSSRMAAAWSAWSTTFRSTSLRGTVQPHPSGRPLRPLHAVFHHVHQRHRYFPCAPDAPANAPRPSGCRSSSGAVAAAAPGGYRRRHCHCHLFTPQPVQLLLLRLDMRQHPAQGCRRHQ